MLRRVVVDALLTLLALTSLWLLLRSGEWLTDERIAPVKLGMTVAEVKAILGKPQRELTPAEASRSIMWNLVNYRSGNYCEWFYIIPPDDWTPTYWVRPDRELGKRCVGFNDKPACCWLGRERILWVVSDEQGTVTDIGVAPMEAKGGGIWGWLSKRYDDWKHPHATRPMPVTVPVK